VRSLKRAGIQSLPLYLTVTKPANKVLDWAMNTCYFTMIVNIRQQHPAAPVAGTKISAAPIFFFAGIFRGFFHFAVQMLCHWIVVFAKTGYSPDGSGANG
jgi:hypothetical protein